MVLVSWRRKLTKWVGQRFRIGVFRLEEFRVVPDCLISGIEDICVRCRSVDKVIVISILNILLDVLHFEVNLPCV